MKAILEYMTSSFWVFVGCYLLLEIIVSAIVKIFEIVFLLIIKKSDYNKRIQKRE